MRKSLCIAWAVLLAAVLLLCACVYDNFPKVGKRFAIGQKVNVVADVTSTTTHLTITSDPTPGVDAFKAGADAGSKLTLEAVRAYLAAPR